MNMAQLYIPMKKIAIASSFEGVVNNGAKECGFVSFNAQQRMMAAGRMPANVKGFFGRSIEPDEFRAQPEIRDSVVMRAFLLLRPLVAVAADYLALLEAIELNSERAKRLVSARRTDDFQFFIGRVNETKENMPKETAAAFKEAFYAEREMRKKNDYGKWLALQEPFMETIAQLRELALLRTYKQNEVKSGFVLYYVTSKDEQSTFELCNIYGELGHFRPGEVGKPLDPAENWASVFSQMQTCLIRRENIVGLETVQTADKVSQMDAVAQKAEVGRKNVWRVNDRYDEAEIAELKVAGFEHNFIVTGGYAFPQDYEIARQNGIPVLEREHMAEQLATYAQEKGF